MNPTQKGQTIRFLKKKNWNDRSQAEKSQFVSVPLADNPRGSRSHPMVKA
jgi:hypothetical protein